MSEATLPTVKWRDSVRFKLMLWSAVLVMVPTLLCAVWLSRMAAEAMSQQHARTVAVTAQTLAASLAGKLSLGVDDSARGLLSSLRLDSRLAFVTVSNARFEPLHQYAADADAWGQYQQWLADAGALGLAHSAPPIMLGRYGELVVHETPIWNPPLDPRNPRQIQPEDRKLEGFVLLALHEPKLIATLDHLSAAQATAAGVICLLAMPIAVWYSKRWTAPVRALLAATGRLALGLSPGTIKVKDKDELGVLAIAFNRSAQQLFAAQAQLRQANEDLEQKVSDRTAELETANRRLESEIHDKNEFLRAVTHDLSAPLRNIGGMANMLIIKHDEQLTDDAITKLKRISANVDVQAGLISDLMELSRIRSRPGKKERIDLQELLRELGENLSYDLERNRITLQIDQGAPTIIAERNRFQQVFMNLLDNGIKYMGDAAERKITISFDQIDDQLQFSVTDTGQGIDAKDVPHVFNVFRRGTYSGTHDVPGRGIGLASVKSIVECYGGRVWVESRRNMGSTFHFTLDARQVAQVQPADAQGPAVTAL
jgi:signal transduction histidine kinase